MPQYNTLALLPLPNKSPTTAEREKLKKYCCTRGNMTLLSWEREKTENIIIYEVELVLAIN